MLILSRKIGEQIVLPGENVVVTVVSVRGSQVRIGITAPKAVHVLRAELHGPHDPAKTTQIGALGERPC